MSVKVIFVFLSLISNQNTLREKFPNRELFLVRIFLYSVQNRKMWTRNNSLFGHFSLSESTLVCLIEENYTF